MNLAVVKSGYPIAMFTMTLQEIKQATAATLVGSELDLASVVRGVNTDSRTIKQGELFVALKGEKYDAHDYISHAYDRGASAYLVDHEIDNLKPALVVKDTRIAFGQLAKAWRNKFSYPIIAVTGSNGKTTVKEMLNSILSVHGNVLATKGNFNNDVGVPITLFRMNDSHSYAVIEMGANHPGEISYLTHLVQPDVAIITNAAAAHLEGFGSLDGVVKAKGEIFEGLSAQGTAIINFDDKACSTWKKLTKNKKIISFGLDSRADVSCLLLAENLMHVHINQAKEFEVKLPLPGKHNVLNALAAIAAAVALDVPLNLIKQGLEQMQAVPGRLVKKDGLNNSIIIDDTYNANPASLGAAMEVLANCNGQLHVVLGDMGEMGEEAVQIHKDAAHTIKQVDVTYLYTIGENSRYTSRAFGNGAQHFQSHAELAEQLKENIQPGDTVLIKGSRAMQMEKIVNSVCNKQQPGV